MICFCFCHIVMLRVVYNYLLHVVVKTILLGNLTSVIHLLNQLPKFSISSCAKCMFSEFFFTGTTPGELLLNPRLSSNHSNNYFNFCSVCVSLNTGSFVSLFKNFYVVCYHVCLFNFCQTQN